MPGFQIDPGRTGWDRHEPALTPAAVAGSRFGLRWTSPVLEPAVIDGRAEPPHIFASPLYLDALAVTSGPAAGRVVHAVLTATGAGWVEAVAGPATGSSAGPAPGRVLWSTFLGPASRGPDGGVPLGVLGTPVIDRRARPPRLYVASDVADGTGRSWRVFALDLGSGRVLPGWPLALRPEVVEPVDSNGPARWSPAAVMSQRGALTLSSDGRILYLPFGGYQDGTVGWLVAVDTAAARVASSFSGAPSLVAAANGGIWGAGGAAIDDGGRVYVTTGNSPHGSADGPGIWGNSLLVFAPGVPLRLQGTYVPWNVCQMDQFDTDLGGSAPLVLPRLPVAATSTPELVAFGGKQGNAYLVDRRHPGGSVLARHACSEDPSTDTSLLPPGPQPQFGTRGPLNVFGPYREDGHNQLDEAKARSSPAAFRAADGGWRLFFSGSTKVALGSRQVRPPSLVRTRVVLEPGQPAALAVDGQDSALALPNPGSPVVTSDGPAHPVVWILDEGQYRSDALEGPLAARPRLVAVDGTSLALLWTSGQLLDVGGKYATPVVAHGTVMVATDRIQAFGVG